MLKELNKNSWKEFCSASHGDIFTELEFIQNIENASEVKIKYFGFYAANKLVAATCLPEKNNTIIHPIDFLYTPFVIDNSINPNVINESVQKGLEELKKRYSSILLKFSPKIIDIRAFNWAGFTSEVRYTYIQDLAAIHYHDSVNKKIDKALNNDITFSIGDNKEKSIVLNLKKLNEFGISANQVKYIDHLIHSLSEDVLQDYNAIFEDQIIASNLILKDVNNKMAYTILLASDKQFQKLGSDVALYDYFFKKLAEQGIQKVDLCGANMKSIAAFKSSFNPELKSYYIVRYDKPIRKLIKSIKGLIKP